MKEFVAILAMTLTTAAIAEGAICNAAAAEKKLTGSAKTAFLQKCEMDSRAKAQLVTKEVVTREKKLSVSPTSSFRNCEHESSDL